MNLCKLSECKGIHFIQRLHANIHAKVNSRAEAYCMWSKLRDSCMSYSSLNQQIINIFITWGSL